MQYKTFTYHFDKVDGYIRKYDRTEYLRLFHSNEKYGRTFDRIRCFIVLRKISDICFQKFMKIN